MSFLINLLVLKTKPVPRQALLLQNGQRTFPLASEELVLRPTADGRGYL
jgi:hypothetical protein